MRSPHLISRLSGATRAIACALGLVCLAQGHASAITFHTTLSPIRLTAQPGQTLTSQHVISLDAAQPRAQFAAHVEDWWRSEDGRESFYVAPGTLARSCGSWVSVNPGEASLAGGEQLTIRVTVSVPTEVRPGGYWCALTVDEQPDPLAVTPESVSVRFLASVSTAIYVNVGQVDRAVRIAGLETAGASVTLDVQNEGNTPVAVEGRLEFTRPGETAPVAVVALERQVLLLEPMPAGRYRTALPDAAMLPDGRYMVRAVLDIGLDHFIGAQRELIIYRVSESVGLQP